ncbi:Putative lipoprotein (fragment) [Burkholderia cenocepacia]
MHDLPHAVGHIEPPGTLAVHRFRLRRDRGAAQPRAAGEPRPAPFRQRAMRHRAAAALARTDAMVRLPAHARAAQRRGQADVHAQRRVHDAARRGRVLQHALDRSRLLVSRRQDVRRRAGRLSRQHQRQLDADEPPARHATRADRRGNRRHRRVPRHADRRALGGFNRSSQH